MESRNEKGLLSLLSQPSFCSSTVNRQSHTKLIWSLHGSTSVDWVSSTLALTTGVEGCEFSSTDPCPVPMLCDVSVDCRSQGWYAGSIMDPSRVA